MDDSRDLLHRHWATGVVLLAFFIDVSDSAIGGLAEFLFLLAALGWVTILGLGIAGRLEVDLDAQRRTTE